MNLLKICNKTIQIGFYLLFAVTPFLFNPTTAYPSYEIFEWNKMIFVYGMGALILAAWAAKSLLTGTSGLKRTPFDIPLLLFIAWQLLATVFSIDRHVSIFGYYSRFHGGLLSLITYTLLYFCYISNLDTIRTKKLLKIALITTGLVALYGIMEKFGVDKDMWIQDVQNRVFSTLGQPNWLAALLAIVLPIAIFFGLNDLIIRRNQRENQMTSPISFSNLEEHALAAAIYFSLSKSRWGYWIFSYLFYICLLFTKSRSGFLGFWVANALFWGLILWNQRKNMSSLKFLAKPFLILNSTFLILNFFIQTPFAGYNQVATIELVKSETTAPNVVTVAAEKPAELIEVGVTDSADIRQIVWKGALEIAKANPVFGTGPETFAFSYYKFKPKEHNLTSEWDFLYNRAHNEFLNIAATSGFVGLGLYLLMITSVAVWMLRLIVHRKGDWVLIASLLASYVGIHITNFFGFSVVIVGLYFFFIPAFVYSLVSPKESLHTTYDLKGSTSIGLFLILTCLLLVVYSLAQFWRSDSLYAHAYALNRQSDFENAYETILVATTMRPNEPVYQDQKGEIAGNLAGQLIENAEATRAGQVARDALKSSAFALELSPHNVNFWKTRTKILFMLSSIDEAFTQHALDSITVASELAPTDAKIRYHKGILLAQVGQKEEAVTELKNTIDLKADYKDAYMALATFYESDGKITEAREILELVLKRINPNDEEVKKKLEILK